jgi:EmrB/QacA subfamily drug resistance transporter
MSREPLTAAQKVTLAAMSCAVLLVAMDFTAIDVAITPIEQDLDSDLSTVQWVINAYLLSFAAFIVTGGRLADIFGRRRILYGGLAIFAAMSLLGSVALTDWWLVGARALQGVGGALIWPAAMGISFAVVPPSRRATAMGLIIGAAGLGTAIGPALGGLLTELVSWRLVLMLNVPVAAIAYAASRKVAEQRDEDASQRMDYAGIVLFAVALVALLLAIDQSSSWGWGDPRTIGLIAAAVVLLVVFWIVEGRVAEALLPRDVIRDRGFLIAALIGPMMVGPFLIILFYVPQLLEKFKGWSTLGAGAGLLPLTLAFALAAPLAGRLYERFGAKAMVAFGCAGVGAGSLIVALVDEATSYAVMVPGLVAFGVGLGVGIASTNTAACASVPANRTSVASGLAYMIRLTLGSVALAIATAIYTSTGESRLSDGLDRIGVSLDSAKVSELEGSLAGTDSAQAVLSELPAGKAEQVEPIVAEAFLGGLHDVMFLAAAIAAAGALLALLFVGRRIPWPHRLHRSTRISGGPFPATVDHHEPTPREGLRAS